jgi:type I restriction enzyme S subunit
MRLHPVYGTPIPESWQVLKVDDVTSPEPSSCVAGPFGSNISSKYFVEHGVPVIRGSNLTDSLVPFVPEGFVFVSEERAKQYRAQHVKAGDLVFTCWGTIGQVGRVPEDGPFPEYIISNKQLKLRANPALVDSRFLYYYFAGPQMVAYIRNRAIGSAVPGINLGILKSLPVPLPPIWTQQRIASILSAYDDLIENNTRRIQILEEMAQAIYREWFVEFRFPGHEDMRMVDSELGPIPEGWEARKMSGIAKVIMGQSPPSGFYNESGEGLPFHQGVTNFGKHFPTHKAFSTSGDRRAETGDILFSVRAPVGRINVADRHLILGRGLCAIRPSSAVTTFLLFQLKHLFQTEDIIGSGSIFNAVKRSDMENLPVIWPADEPRTRFEELANPMFSLIKTLTYTIRALQKSRDLLLPRLISGEIDVSHLDIGNAEPAA